MRKIFLLLFCVLLAVGVNAQIRYGVKAGGTFSNISEKYNGEKISEFKLGVGFNLGGVLEYSFSESFALQPELLYVMNNIKPKEEEEGVSSRMELQFIQLPINLKYKMGTENLKFYVTAGPYVGYAVSAKLKAESEGISGAVDLFEWDEFKAKHLNFGIGAGLGIEVSKFTVGVGYQHGLANLTGVDQVSIKLGSFNLSVGYFF
ncbi:MAG: PorT family protein [Prevotellaceae bacterium]|jgi:hypothetical protein|nr:PorT family protein [Prevotellaceae bacterium]